jgi:hypothetical protein
LFSILESLLAERNQEGAAKLIEIVQGWRQKLIETGYQELVFEDALDLFVDFLKQVSNMEVCNSAKAAVSCAAHAVFVGPSNKLIVAVLVPNSR